MKKLALAFALITAPVSASLAYADDNVEAESGGGEGEAAAGEHGEGHDPSQHFNWATHLSPFGSSSYNNVDEHGGTLQAGEEHMSVPFVFVLINFGIILFILGWKVAPMARQMAEKRSDDIKGALDEAAKLRDQAKAKLDEYSSKLRAAETEIDTMIKTMREDAESERQRIIAAAEAQAAALKKDAEERIAAEIERARVMLQREVVLAATGVAEQLLRDKTTPADQAKLVDAFLGNVAAAATEARGRT
jgi:F-type H+-transporting ATPase subunit b